MITEHLQNQASLYAVGALPEAERKALEAELGSNPELRELVRDLGRSADALAFALPQVAPPAGLKARVMARIESIAAAPAPVGLRFLRGSEEIPWKALPVPGAFIKLLSFERERGYAVLLGKLEAGARYPAHVNSGPEDFFILTGDLHIGDTALTAGDFHHADKGSQHAENHSVGGCTLLAVLTVDDPLVAFAMA